MNTNNLDKKKLVPNQRLREERERRSWTYKDVADRIDLPDHRSVGRWERGVSRPNPHYRRELCRIFEKSLEELDLLKPHADKDEILEDTEPTNAFAKLPAFFSSFIGREQDVLAARDMLLRPDARLLILLGPGGIGKTRLAIEVATQLREHFRDGVCFVSLEAIRDPSLVISSIADALGVYGRMNFSLIQQVKIFLQRKNVLLLLDNFEQVVSAASVIEEILQECQQVKALVTSRQLLNLQAEHKLAVPPLTLPDLNHLPAAKELTRYTAVALFVLRAQTIYPEYTLTASNAQVIAELCTRLDGLPLAIELAVARIKVLSLQSLLDRLSQDMHILKSDLQTIPERQRTLYQTIEWSYNLLNAQEKWLFWHLSVFAGSVTLETLEVFFQSPVHTTQLPLDLLETLTSLLGKSLLYCLDPESAEPRFTMLGTIRTYGLHYLQADGELEESMRAYALYYLTVVEEAALSLKGSQQFVWLKKLGREQDNLRAALKWFIEREETELALRFCESFSKFCGLSGYWSEEQRWLNAVLLLPHTRQEQAIRAKVLRRAGHLAYRMRNLVNARILLEESIASSREVGDTQNLAGALSNLGWVLYRQNETVVAGDVFQESVNVAYQSGDDWVLANALESYGQFLYRQGKTEEAHVYVEKSVSLSLKLGNTESLARILTTLVGLEIALGNTDQAFLLAQESSRLAFELGTGPLIALTLDTLGDVALFQGAYEQARQYIKECIAMAHEFSNAPAVASRQLKLADIALALGHPEPEVKVVEASYQFLRQQEDIPGIIEALSVLGDLKRFDGNALQAKSLYQQALQLYQRPGDEKKFARSLVGLAQIFLEQGLVEYTVSLASVVEVLIKPAREMHPAQYKEYQQMKERARAQLDEARFSQAWSQGSTASLDQILETLFIEE